MTPIWATWERDMKTEQRSWLKQRDEQATKNCDSWEGGTLAKVDYQDTMATMTMERCEKLLEYIKKECN